MRSLRATACGISGVHHGGCVEDDAIAAATLRGPGAGAGAPVGVERRGDPPAGPTFRACCPGPQMCAFARRAASRAAGVGRCPGWASGAVSGEVRGEVRAALGALARNFGGRARLGSARAACSGTGTPSWPRPGKHCKIAWASAGIYPPVALAEIRCGPCAGRCRHSLGTELYSADRWRREIRHRAGAHGIELHSRAQPRPSARGRARPDRPSQGHPSPCQHRVTAQPGQPC
jgi:hypothetical protein